MMDLAKRLEEIERALDGDSYRVGPWQEFLEQAAAAGPETLRAIEPDVTRVSDKLHLRKQPRTLGFERALAIEILAAFAGLLTLAVAAAAESTLGFVLAALVLCATLQPVLKVATGLCLGFRYAYGYLWKGEPRFKLQYGAYLSAPPWKRVCLHASGALGSPFGWLLVASVCAGSHPTLSAVLFWLSAAHLLLQLVLFGLACAGLPRIPVLGTLRLTSPGGAGWELRRSLSP